LHPATPIDAKKGRQIFFRRNVREDFADSAILSSFSCAPRCRKLKEKQSPQSVTKKQRSGHHNLVRKFRRRLGLTQRELAQLIGFRAPAQVCRLERGLRRPSFLEAFRLQLVFRVPITQVFARVSELARADLITQLVRLNEKFLRSGCLQPRVGHKAGQLAEVLASLRNQDRGNAGTSPWSITPLEDDAER
jgi:transcriptional regulator with XRE-family HTH domain